MDAAKIHRWVSMSANIGVLIGLIFLIVELKYANDLGEASAYRSRGEEIQISLQEIALSADLTEIWVKANKQGLNALSDVEMERYRSWIWAGVFRMQNQFNDHKLGFLDEHSYQGMLAEAARRYPAWKELNLPLKDPDFVRAVEATLVEGRADNR